MDFLGYAVLGGFERVAIVGGAILIGYWGYRIYGRDKTPGLVLLGLACVVLVSALITGGGHVRSVSEGIQLARLPEAPAASVEPAAAVAATTLPAAAEIPWADGQPASAAAGSSAAAGARVAADARAVAEPLAESDDAVELAEAPAEVVEATASNTEAGVDQTLDIDTADEATENSLPLATGQELGGRIVSVKSANVSLEWSERE
ncbi:MAG: hypothetical protein O6766_02635 [Gammaproteobacteria bacterium]|nr:hypothetical protein [Gammaproteobacteria bacterium]